MHEYFISYVFQGPGGPSFGSCTTILDDPITSVEQVRAFETVLRRQGYDNAAVLGFSLLLSGADSR
jgi:hypothetical protein